MGTQRGSGAPSLPPAPAGWLASHAPAMPCLRSCAAAVAWVSLLAVPVHAASNVTVSLWGKPEAECQGQPDVVHSYEADHCTYGRLFALPTNSSDDGPGDDDAEWFRIRCEGFLTVEVFKYIYEDKDCQGGYLRQPMEEPGRCLVVVDGDAPQQQFVADAVISCGPHARQWPVSGMTLMAVGVVAVCLCGHCHARRSGRGFNRNHRRTTRSVSGESIYDPTTFRPGYSSSPAATAGGAAAASSPLSRGGLAASQQANQGRNAADVLPPACLAIIEEAGGAQLNLQQITQQVLRSKQIAPADKRHCMMLLFRHYRFAGEEGGEKPPSATPPPPPMPPSPRPFTPSGASPGSSADHGGSDGDLEEGSGASDPRAIGGSE